MKYDVSTDGKLYRVQIDPSRSGYRSNLDGRISQIDVAFVSSELVSLAMEGKNYLVRREKTADKVVIWVGTENFEVQISDPKSLRGKSLARRTSEGRQPLLAPMPGKVVRILAEAGTEVVAGQGIVVVEAMKMQNEVKAPKSGRLSRIAVAADQAVNAGDVLAEVE